MAKIAVSALFVFVWIVSTQGLATEIAKTEIIPSPYLQFLLEQTPNGQQTLRLLQSTFPRVTSVESAIQFIQQAPEARVIRNEMLRPIGTVRFFQKLAALNHFPVDVDGLTKPERPALRFASRRFRFSLGRHKELMRLPKKDPVLESLYRRGNPLLDSFIEVHQKYDPEDFDPERSFATTRALLSSMGVEANPSGRMFFISSHGRHPLNQLQRRFYEAKKASLIYFPETLRKDNADAEFDSLGNGIIYLPDRTIALGAFESLSWHEGLHNFFYSFFKSWKNTFYNSRFYYYFSINPEDTDWYYPTEIWTEDLAAYALTLKQSEVDYEKAIAHGDTRLAQAFFESLGNQSLVCELASMQIALSAASAARPGQNSPVAWHFIPDQRMQRGPMAHIAEFPPGFSHLDRPDLSGKQRDDVLKNTMQEYIQSELNNTYLVAAKLISAFQSFRTYWTSTGPNNVDKGYLHRLASAPFNLLLTHEFHQDGFHGRALVDVTKLKKKKAMPRTLEQLDEMVLENGWKGFCEFLKQNKSKRPDLLFSEYLLHLRRVEFHHTRGIEDALVMTLKRAHNSQETRQAYQFFLDHGLRLQTGIVVLAQMALDQLPSGRQPSDHDLDAILLSHEMLASMVSSSHPADNLPGAYKNFLMKWRLESSFSFNDWRLIKTVFKLYGETTAPAEAEKIIPYLSFGEKLMDCAETLHEMHTQDISGIEN